MCFSCDQNVFISCLFCGSRLKKQAQPDNVFARVAASVLPSTFAHPRAQAPEARLSRGPATARRKKEKRFGWPEMLGRVNAGRVKDIIFDAAFFFLPPVCFLPLRHTVFYITFAAPHIYSVRRRLNGHSDQRVPRTFSAGRF